MRSSEPVTINEPKLWLTEYPFPKKTDHKYTRGHVLIAGGAVMTGAARLAAGAAQRMGAGLVTLAAPSDTIIIYATALQSAIIRECDDIYEWTKLLDNETLRGLLLGPGFGIGAKQKKMIAAALETKKTCILDADALNNFSDNPRELFSKLHKDCLLTPHEAEFERLFGKLLKEKNKSERALEGAQLSHSKVLLKGADTYIATPEGHLIHNSNAPPWLATAGSGDVLAGMILGLSAQKMPLVEAAAAAVWVHGQVAHNFGLGLIAEDIVDGIPKVLNSLSKL